jgi:hypothetical protein
MRVRLKINPNDPLSKTTALYFQISCLITISRIIFSMIYPKICPMCGEHYPRRINQCIRNLDFVVSKIGLVEDHQYKLRFTEDLSLLDNWEAEEEDISKDFVILSPRDNEIFYYVNNLLKLSQPLMPILSEDDLHKCVSAVKDTFAHLRNSLIFL